MTAARGSASPDPLRDLARGLLLGAAGGVVLLVVAGSLSLPAELLLPVGAVGVLAAVLLAPLRWLLAGALVGAGLVVALACSLLYWSLELKVS